MSALSGSRNCCSIRLGHFSEPTFLKMGFLDGIEGLTIAYMAGLYNFVKYSKVRSMSPGRKD